jgi:hypothetical protein
MAAGAFIIIGLVIYAGRLLSLVKTQKDTRQAIRSKQSRLLFNNSSVICLKGLFVFAGC